MADVLTATRLLLAPVLLASTWSRGWQIVALLLSIAWLTDVLDGRLARGSKTPTRLGSLDLPADTAVGAALLIGLAGAGELPGWFAIAALLVLGGLYAKGNFAASMLLQLSGFIPTLAVLWRERPFMWFLPMVTAAFIALLDWRRLIEVNIPGFIQGIRGQFERDGYRGD